MRKRINLFTIQKKKSSQIMIRTQRVSIGFGLFLFIIFLSINLIYLYTQIQLNAETKKKAEFLQTLNTSKDTQANILYFSRAQNTLQSFLKDDAQFLPYYKLLKDLLQFSSNSPILDTMSIDKSKVTDFTVKFDSFGAAYDFLHYVESDTFLKNFSDLTLDRFSVVQQSQGQSGYQLHFHGTFKNII